MAKKLFLGLVALVLVFLVLVAMRPSEFMISRSTHVNAPADAIFPHVNDFHQWDAWDPWVKKDPAQKVTHAGAAMGVGAEMSWVGNKEVGEGKMTLTQSQAPDSISIQVDFLKPMAATHMVDFSFKPEEGGTLVTWSMTGHRNFIAKAFDLVLNMDKMVGGDFELGLAQLKTVTEGAPAPTPTNASPESAAPSMTPSEEASGEESPTAPAVE